MKKIFLPLFSAVLFLASCTKDDSGFDGPSLNDIYGDFSILDSLSASAATVDFSAGQQLTFSAEFSKNVNWKIAITGNTSGAVYTIEGFSRLIDATNAIWDGSATTLPMFRSEDCVAQLTIDGEDDTLTAPISVLGTKVITGLILSDFEGEFNPGWNTFVQSGADMSFIITDSDPAAQGSKYYDMGGTVDWDWLLGLIDIPGSAYGATTFALNSNPNNVYFNVMLSKIPGLNNGLVLFQFREDDNGDGVYTDGEEDLFSIEVALNNEDGWQLISSKYADMPTLVNGAPVDPIGNGIYEPEKLIQVSILMLANPVSGYAQAYMDLMLFTENQPFKP